MAKILKQQISPISKTHHQFSKPKHEKFNFSIQFRTKPRNQKKQTLNERIRRQISPISKTHYQFAKPKHEKFNFSIQLGRNPEIKKSKP